MRVIRCFGMCLVLTCNVAYLSAQSPSMKELPHFELIANRTLTKMQLKESVERKQQDAVLKALAEITEIEGKLFGITDPRHVQANELHKRLVAADEHAWSTYFSYHENAKRAAALFSDGEIKKSLYYAEKAASVANDFFGIQSIESNSARQTLLAFQLFMAKVKPAEIDCNALLASAQGLQNSNSANLIAQILAQLGRYKDGIAILEPIAVRQKLGPNTAKWISTSAALVQLYALNSQTREAEVLAKKVALAISTEHRGGNKFRPILAVGRAMISRAKGDLENATKEATIAADSALINYGRHSPYFLGVLIDVNGELQRSEKADYWQAKLKDLSTRAVTPIGNDS